MSAEPEGLSTIGGENRRVRRPSHLYVLEIDVLCRYSGSDIAIIVRDALMQPVRKVLSATHFKKVDVDGTQKWTPCSPGDPEAVEKSWTEIGSDELLEPPLRMNDFLRAVDSVRPTVTEEDIKKHVDWTNDSGESIINPTLGPLIDNNDE